MSLFYQSVIDSVFVFGVAVWGGCLTAKDKRLMNRVKRCAQRIVWKTLTPLEAVYSARLQQMGHKFLADKKHLLNHIFQLLPSERRLRQLRTRTNKLKNSMIPHAIRALNMSM